MVGGFSIKYMSYNTHEKHHNWLKNPKKYSTIHGWLIRDYGKATKCENPKCLGKSKTYDYALIKGKEYKRIRKSFIQLCRSCHCKYDLNEKLREIRRELYRKRKKDKFGRFV